MGMRVGSGGGGAASAIVVNSTIKAVAAGGGGGGGYGDDGSGGATAGLPGGVYSGLTSTTVGQSNAGGCGVGGGGGGGYKGGLTGTSYGDDGQGGEGGSGGQNYALEIPSQLINGSGTSSGNVIAGQRYGDAGYAGYAKMTFTRTVQILNKQSGTWTTISNVFYKTPTTSVTSSVPASIKSNVFTSGTTVFTVPARVTSIAITALGAGGGAGGNDAGAAGHAGYPGAVVSYTVSVTPGDKLTINIGTGGKGGLDGTGGATGGLGGTDPAGIYNGGLGGNAGGSGSSGGGGGGGAATSILLNGSTLLVAAGGGGGGGAGNGPVGLGQASATYNSTPVGLPGTNKSGDGGGGGAGGAGYPYGGAGGATVGGDSGAYSGITGQSLVPGGGSLNTGTNGGAASGGNGGPGSVTFVYTENATTIITSEGGWKPAEMIYIKDAGVWKPLLSNTTIAPTKV